MKKVWHFFERLVGIYRWHPKIALRYLPIVEIINGRLGRNASVLEVGSSGIGISPYIGRSVVGIDLTFPPPIHPDLIPIKASALDLPFAADSFDVVISMDMLEHIAPIDREKAISEIVRVGSKLICIGVPAGVLAEKQDDALKKMFEKSRHAQYQYLTEQVEYGLPTVDEVSVWISSAAKKYHKKNELSVSGNINLNLRLWLMQGWLSKKVLVDVFFRKILLLCIPFMRQLNQEPTYRKLFIVTIIE